MGRAVDFKQWMHRLTLSFICFIKDGDAVILYEQHNAMKANRVCESFMLWTHIGELKYSDWNDKPFESKMVCNKSQFAYLIAPTRVSCMLVFSYKTQILYIFYVVSLFTYLELVFGCLMLEFGIGSESSLSISRGANHIQNVNTIDFEEQGAAKVRNRVIKNGGGG